MWFWKGNKMMQDEEDEKAETGMCKEEDEKGLRGYL